MNPRLPTLPLHLMFSLLAWTSLNAASASWKSGSPQAQSRLRREGRKRLENVLASVERYLETPYARPAEQASCVLRHGSARLLDYGKPKRGKGLPVLVVPSLVNRYYILDLMPGNSLAEYLRHKGFRVFILDWGAPGQKEEPFDCAAYVTGPLKQALKYINQQHSAPVLAGYCMGGVLTMALARLWPERVRALALLATPWEFTGDAAPPALPPLLQTLFAGWLSSDTPLPPEALMAAFGLADPFQFEEKYLRFAGMRQGTEPFHRFLAVENWVNDGVPLARPVAQECFMQWGQENLLALGEWRVDGKRITPKKIKLPCFAAIPHADRVVPPASALPLARALDDCTLVRPRAGHVGMIVGSKAKEELWEPLVEWCAGV